MMDLTRLFRNRLANVTFILGYIIISLLLVACNQGAVRPEYAGGADYDTQRRGLPANYSVDEIKKFHAAAILNNVSELREWIKDGNDIDATYDLEGNWHQSGYTGTTALILAASNENLEAVKFLVEEGANLYAQTIRMPSHKNIKPYKTFLVKNKNNPENNNKDEYIEIKYSYNGNSAFDNAVSGGNYEIVKFLWEKSDKKVYKYKANVNLTKPVRSFCEKDLASYRKIVIFLIKNVADSEQILEVLKDQPVKCQNKIHELISKTEPNVLDKLPSLHRLKYITLERLYLRSKSNTYWTNKNDPDDRSNLCYECNYKNIYTYFHCSKIIAETSEDKDYIKKNYCQRLKDIEFLFGDEAYEILHSQPGRLCNIGGIIYTANINLDEVKQYCGY